MDGCSISEGSDNLSELLITEKYPWEWKGNVTQLTKYLGRRFLKTDSPGNEHMFEAKFGCIKFDDSTNELYIEGEGCKTLKQILKSRDKCTREKCNEVYPNDHIKQRVGDERILGTLDQFCAAFYHVHKWSDHQYVCLDEKNCIIAKRATEPIKKAEEFAKKAEEFATKRYSNDFVSKGTEFASEAKKYLIFFQNSTKYFQKFGHTVKESFKQLEIATTKPEVNEPDRKKAMQPTVKAATKLRKLAGDARNSSEGWNVQPKTVVAVVKFENPRGKILYEARYTNCRRQKMHAENFFKNDIEDEDGVFNELIQDNPKGTITLYLTYQPCNESITNTETSGTRLNHSCCSTLQNIATGILKRNNREIELYVKAAHNYRLESRTGELELNARRGIKELMESGVKVSGMTQDDWDYLFTLTKDNKDRKLLDQKVESVLRDIREILKNDPEKDKQSSFTPNTADVTCSNKGKETSVSGEIDLTASPDCYDVPRYLANGIDINDHDIATLDADAMMNDNIVTVLLREHQCPFPIIHYLFYSILVGEQEGTSRANWEDKLQGASTYFKPEQYQQDFVIIPIVRRLHWLLMIMTPWHILILDSLTHDLSKKTEEISLVKRYLDHMCSINNIEKKHVNLQPAILKVPLQPSASNDCGIFVSLFLKHFFQDLNRYKENPNLYIENKHQWFTDSAAQEERANEKRKWKVWYEQKCKITHQKVINYK